MFRQETPFPKQHVSYGPISLFFSVGKWKESGLAVRCCGSGAELFELLQDLYHPNGVQPAVLEEGCA
jgi:hypothetical protein